MRSVERGMFVEYALHLNVMIGASLCVPQMALSTVPSSGTYNLGQAQIDLFTQNIEAILDTLKDVINKQLIDDFRIYNFGKKCPPLRVVIEPVSTDVSRMLLQALIQNLSMGVPVMTQDGKMIMVDNAKLCTDFGVPIILTDPPQQPPTPDPADPNPNNGAPEQAEEPTGIVDTGSHEAEADTGDGKQHTGGSLQKRSGDKEAANNLPGQRGGMLGQANKKEGHLGLSEYRPLSEKLLEQLESVSHVS